ncbi:pyruvate formate-lyase-activating protein [uncultured Ruminococcus sp.]|uniref:pyruvate formate-lyase-activating protein n=1 Tax=uncultured Ruminococcus sp. TaxID=165186 RepID=UPI0025E6F51B|nr:pyruvate formate-lyase-activating protein [uncultured Ruminococcus sp.]
MVGHIHSTESFGTVDGPGIRFVIFFQGCPMRCLYCHNPDTWSVKGGMTKTVDELLAEYDSVKEFMRDGGITCTGGEPMLQLEFLTELFEKAKEKGIHTCLDTSGITFNEKKIADYERLVKSTDLVMLDIKHIDDEEHKKLTGQSNKNILAFARFLSDRGVSVWIRHVVVPNITDNDEYLFRLGQFLADIKTLKALDVLPYHTMGKPKYEQLGMEYPLGDTPPLDKQEAVRARNVVISGLKSELKKRIDENKKSK